MRRVAVIAFLVLLTPAKVASAEEPRLAYSAAKRVAQAKADGFAGVATRITSLYRIGSWTYSARAEWTRQNPVGCTGCGIDPNTGDIYDTPSRESCSVDLRVRRLRSGMVKARAEGFACY